ncbi:hypothetical protein BD560DRAFT_416602 [Blakeslea trispora]|nr:hypothetical protein BD560DRAFT_416602 [Blakeslea trispora]
MAWQPNETYTKLSLKRVYDTQKEDEKPKKKYISLSKTRSHSQPCSQSRSPILKKEDTDYTSPTIPIKHESLDPSLEDFKWEMKHDTLHEIDLKQPKEEQKTGMDQVKSEIKQEEEAIDSSYHCPLCNQDLTAQKSSFLRQRHVDQCITSMEVTQPIEKSEFDDCPFCAKDLTRLTAERRQLHLNECLDEIDCKMREHEQLTFAGQQVPFLTTLDICPVCHEDGPFKNRALRQKMKHIKQCAKKSRLSIDDLVQKLKWIGWGHLPIQTNEAPSSTTTTTLQHQTLVHVEDTLDDDFSDRVIVSKANKAILTERTKERRRQEDQQDEELQTALAISKSMIAKRTRAVTDWNVANVWSMDESRRHAKLSLDAVLFPSDQDKLYHYMQAQRERSLGKLGPSQLNGCQDKHFWKLASLSHPTVSYTAKFLQLHNKGV